ncbi:MAG: sigma-70 family RNA polymerase sigma factor [Chloroflexota bacterium]
MTATLANEGDIVRRSLTDLRSFATVYQHYFPRVYNYMLYRVGDPQTAADLTARTFELALSRLGQYDPSRGGFGGWLFTIAHNTVNRHWRRHQLIRWLPLDAVSTTPDAVPLPEEAVLTAERYRKLLRAVAALPQREQNIIAMRFGADMTHRHIADVIGVSAANVRVILHRSIKQLRILLETDHD